MSCWDLPLFVEIDGTQYAIRNKCDYRVVLDVIEALNDDDLDIESRIKCALFIFYENLSECNDLNTAVKKMMEIVNNGEKDESEEQPQKPRLMDWQHDFALIAPPVSRILGYDVRTPNKYCHWWSFLGAYQEIGECAFANVVSIRSKRQKGKKLEKHEQEFYKENRKKIDLPLKLSSEDQEFLDGEW